MVDPGRDPTQPPARHPQPSKVRYAVMAFLCVLSFLTYFDRVCIVRAQSDIQNDLHLSDVAMGWILGAFWFAYAVFEIPSGFLGDRYGARGTLTRIVIAWSIFTALSGCAVGFWSLLTYRFLFGVGEAGAYPNMARIQAAWLPPRARARAGGLLWLCARWGGAFSPVLFGKMLRGFNSESFRHVVSGTFLEHLPAWRMGFWASGILGAMWVLAFWPWFRDNPAHKRSVSAAELALIQSGRAHADQTASHARIPGLFRALISSPSLWALAILYTCVSFGWSFFVSWVPRFFKDVHHVKFEDSEWLTAWPLFFGGVSCLLGGLLSDLFIRATGRRRLGRAIFPVTGYLLAVIAMLAVRFAHTPGQASILLCLAAAALDFGQGANWASIVDIGGRYAGTATGFINTIGNLGGNFLQPIIGAWIFNHLGWDALFATYAATSLAAAGLWIFINPTRRFYPEPAREPDAKPVA
jgi:ACS family glucarate transporter-like MFS transporter